MSTASVSRRAFLRGSFRQTDNATHPPWTDIDFLELCERCDDCINACEEKIIKRGDGGYPAIDFSLGGCTLCGHCRDACTHNAFNHGLETAWTHIATINEHCLSARGIVCRACGDNCDERAIIFRLQTGGRAQSQLNTDRCNGCGFCISVCPENAIHMETNL